MSIDQDHFNRCYSQVDERTRESFYAFRTRHQPRICRIGKLTWQYAVLGHGEAAAVFIPGAIGTYDIWWQQLDALAKDLQLISISYPAVGTLEDLQSGVNAVLEQEGIDRFHVIGSSLGGYLAQYLVSTQPDRLLSATFANTFAPTIPLLPAAPLLRLAIRSLPIELIHAIYLRYSQIKILPAGGGDPLLAAFLKEVPALGFSKAEALARLSCVTQKFTPANPAGLSFPVLIIDCDNDPLIPRKTRQAVRALYPDALHHSLGHAGHFAYLTQPARYTALLRSFLVNA